MTKDRKVQISLAILFLALASLACNLPARQNDLPPTAQPMSTQELQSLEDQLKATLESTDASGNVTLTITQDQLNSVISSQYANQPDSNVTEPSVVLTDGHVEFYGKYTQSGLTANLKIVFEPKVDETGKPRLNIASITMGGFPVPDTIKNQVGEMTDQAFQNYVDSTAGSFKVETITITEGLMTITGKRQ
jgi:uncharacterized protein YpmS